VILYNQLALTPLVSDLDISPGDFIPICQLRLLASVPNVLSEVEDFLDI
jgi:hypothetical protein